MAKRLTYGPRFHQGSITDTNRGRLRSFRTSKPWFIPKTKQALQNALDKAHSARKPVTKVKLKFLDD